MAEKYTLDQFVSELGLEFAREYALVGVGPGVKLFQFNWPRKTNRTKYDRWVYVMQFTDGTFTQMLDTCAILKKDAIKNLKSMAGIVD